MVSYRSGDGLLPRGGRHGRSGLALAVVLGAFAVLSVIGAPVGRAQSTVPPPAGVPAAPQTNLSPYPVLQHLGRWDGRTFLAVTAGSIRGGHVVFMAHGWSPGFLAAYQRLQATSSTLVTAWTPGLVNAANESLLDTWVPVAQGLQAADPGSTIVFFSWVDQSATGDDPLQARNGEDATEVNGHRLATAIDQALAPDFAAAGGQVHLLGHSFGANVATTAALAVRAPPRQLTLLDSPETDLALLGGAKNDLRYKLPRLHIGRGPGQTFVDNYISYVGIAFAGYPGLDQVVDVTTAPPSGDGPGQKHSFAIVWYRTSAQNLAAGVGMAWSPLLGADDAPLGSSYVQPSPDNVLALTQVTGTPTPGVRTQLLVSTSAMKVPGDDLVRRDAPDRGAEAPASSAETTATGAQSNASADTRATGGTAATRTATTVGTSTGETTSPSGTANPGGAPGATGTTGVVREGPAGEGGVQLGGAAPTTWNLTFSTDQTSLWLDFHVALAGTAGDSLSLFVDGRQRSQAAVPDAGTGGAGSFVILYDLTPGDHTLSATLTGPGSATSADASTTATVSHIEMSSTADIQRNLTAEETHGLVIAALIAVAAVAILFVAFVIFVIIRLLRLARRRRRPTGATDSDADPEAVLATVLPDEAP